MAKYRLYISIKPKRMLHLPLFASKGIDCYRHFSASSKEEAIKKQNIELEKVKEEDFVIISHILTKLGKNHNII